MKYNIQESNDNFNQDNKITITNGLNAQFRKNHYNYETSYKLKDLKECGDKGEISWLYRKGDDCFVINKAGFEKNVSAIVGENMTYTEILTELEIDTDNKESKQQHTKRGNVRGFEVTKKELAEILAINIEKE